MPVIGRRQAELIFESSGKDMNGRIVQFIIVSEKFGQTHGVIHVCDVVVDVVHNIEAKQLLLVALRRISR